MKELATELRAVLKIPKDWATDEEIIDATAGTFLRKRIDFRIALNDVIRIVKLEIGEVLTELGKVITKK